jgi:hypothetical protein
VGNYREITPQLISLLNNIIWLNAIKNIFNFPLHPAWIVLIPVAQSFFLYPLAQLAGRGAGLGVKICQNFGQRQQLEPEISLNRKLNNDFKE